MEKPLRLVGVLVLVGLVIGGVYGSIASRTIGGCEVDGIGLPANATCYRLFGKYLSSTTYYTLAVGLGGMTVGLLVGVFIAIPTMLWRRDDQGPPGHLLENPLAWFGLQVVEFAIVVPALLFWIPDPGVWTEGLRWAVAVAALLGLTFTNYALRRRFLPKRDPLAATTE